MSLNWLAMAVSYYFDSFIFPKIAGFVIAIVGGLTFMPTYYAITAEICGEGLLFGSLLSNCFANAITNFIGPYVLTSKNMYGIWCFINLVICLFFTVFGYFYLIETQGLEKQDIYDILRKIKTRKEVLDERKKQMKKIAGGVAITSLRSIRVIKRKSEKKI